MVELNIFSGRYADRYRYLYGGYILSLQVLQINIQIIVWLLWGGYAGGYAGFASGYANICMISIYSCTKGIQVRRRQFYKQARRCRQIY